jgi:hypothetical protein
MVESDQACSVTTSGTEEMAEDFQERWLVLSVVNDNIRVTLIFTTGYNNHPATIGEMRHFSLMRSITVVWLERCSIKPIQMKKKGSQPFILRLIISQ